MRAPAGQASSPEEAPPTPGHLARWWSPAKDSISDPRAQTGQESIGARTVWYSETQASYAQDPVPKTCNPLPESGNPFRCQGSPGPERGLGKLQGGHGTGVTGAV